MRPFLSNREVSKKQASATALTILALWLVQACGGAGQELKGTGTPVLPTVQNLSTTPGPTYDVEALRATAVAIAQVLPTTSPIPGLAPDKAASIQSTDLWGRAQGTALALYPPPPGYYPPGLFTPVAATTAGPETPHQVAGAGVIWEESWSPDFSSMMVVANQWVEMSNNQIIVVCAGRKSQSEDPLQGVVLVAVRDSNTGQILSGPDIYMTPTREGYVRVDDAVGYHLTIKAENGTLFYFDVLSRQWETPTPIPSVSPAISPVPSIPAVPVVSPSVVPMPTPSVLP